MKGSDVKAKTENKVIGYIKEKDMLNSGDTLIIGVSGGADSMCLLLLLQKYREKHPITIYVVHINHGIRTEAGEDEAFVEEYCRNYGIPFRAVHENVPIIAEKQHLTEEEAGRRIRYEAFNKLADEICASEGIRPEAVRIAVAHNLNDLAETALFNMLRGSSLTGLSGIKPVRHGKYTIIRPLLCLERSEIEEYLKSTGQSYCTDSTNATDDYARNRIRHNIIPVAERDINSNAVMHIAEAAKEAAEADEYIGAEAECALRRCVVATLEGCERSYCLQALAFLKEAPIIQKKMLHIILTRLSPGHKDISRIHIDKLQELFYVAGNRSVDLPFGISAIREYNNVFIGFLDERDEAENVNISMKEVALSELEIYKNSIKVPSLECTKWFDYDKINSDPIVRTRLPGDYISISGGKKSLKKYFIDEKIPKSERDRMLLLADGSHIMWILKGRISEYYKITETTKRVLRVDIGEQDTNQGNTL